MHLNDFQFVDQTTNTKVPLTETANFLTEYFANVGIRKYLSPHVFRDFIVNAYRYEIGNVTLAEVKNLIKRIDLNKDSCIDGVSSNILKSAFSVKPEA